jgi:hypothetical protein
VHGKDPPQHERQRSRSAAENQPASDLAEPIACTPVCLLVLVVARGVAG